MKLHQLRSFETVARVGNITRAAEELFLTQPSLSRQIATLEADLGNPLFRRGSSGVRLTDAGEALLPIARRMLGDADLARRALDEISGLRRGHVRLGAPPTVCVSLMADVLATFRAKHPGIELHVTEGGSRLLVEALDASALDLAFVVTRGEAPPAAAIELIPLLAEELVVISPADAEVPGIDAHALGEELSLAALAELPQVAFNRSYDLRIATDAAFEANRLDPTIAVEGVEMDAVLRFVERGLGVAVVPAMVVIDRPTLRSTRLVDPQLTRTVNLARRSDVELSAAAAAMQRAVFETVDRLADAGTALSQLITSVPR